MPALDGTGPRGQGPMTGRGLGYCSPGYARGYGLGYRRFGRGFGFVRGWGWPYYSRGPTAKEEKEILADELKGLKEEMKEIEGRLEELKNKKTK